MTADTFTFLTYNIKAGQYHRDGLEAVARVIEGLAPDVVALQEVDCVAQRTGRVDQAVWLSERLGLHNVFGPSFTFPRTGGQYGNALLSRWPVETSHVFPLPQPPRRTSVWFRWLGPVRGSPSAWRWLNRLRLAPLIRQVYWLAEPRSVLATRLRVPFGPLPVLVTHFGLQAEERLAQAGALLQIIQEWAPRGPLVVAGDFNAGPDSHEMARLRGAVTDVADALGLTGEARLTFPSGPLGARTEDGWAGAIDYIFVRDLTLRTIRVAYDVTQASDHQPLVADFLPAARVVL